MVAGNDFRVVCKVKSLIRIAKQLAPKPEMVAGKAFSGVRKVMDVCDQAKSLA